MLCRKHGAQLCYTPMLHSRLFVESQEYREKMFEKHIQDRPLVVQVRQMDNEQRSVSASVAHVISCGDSSAATTLLPCWLLPSTWRTIATL